MYSTPRVVALRGLFAAVPLLLLNTPAAVAQTSGTLTGTTTTYNYSTAPWVITGGSGTYPDGGGTATFTPIIGATPGTVATLANVTMDVSPTLSQIVANTPFYYNLAAGTGTSVVASATGLTIDTQSTAVNVTLAGNPISIPPGFVIFSPVSGGGTAGLTKTGAGNLYLAGGSTYTGGTHFNGGLVNVASSAAVGDTVFGATGAGNGLSFNGGSVLFNTTGGLTTARDVFIDAGGGTFLANTATTIGGVISGSGTLTNTGFGAATLTLTGANTHTGAVIGRGVNSNIALSGAGTLAASASYDLTGTLTLNNATTNVNNRIGDTAAITSRGVTISLAGNSAAATSEVAGALTLGNGNTTITVTPNAATASTLTVASITRQNNSTLFVRGTALGSVPAANVANVIATAAPTLIGGGGAPGSTTISIIPWAAGNTTAAATLGSSLLTSGANGLRPLAVAEYSTTLGANATDNVRLTAATTAPASTANALVFAPAAAATISGGPITLTSGTFLYSPTAVATGTVTAGLNFGTAEGVVMTTNTLVLSGVTTGTGGVTYSSLSGSAVFSLTGLSTYTGQTTLLGGQYNLGAGTIANDGVTAGPFGLSTTPIVMATGNNTLFFFPSGGATINRDLSIQGQGAGSIFLLNTSTTTAVTYNGNIDIQRPVGFYGSTVAATPGAIVVNGTVSGSGQVTEQGGTFALVSLNGNNTYTGGTNIIVSTFAAGSNTAFGTGLVTFNGAGAIRSTDSTARTVANNLLLNANPTFSGTGALTFTGNVNLNGTRSIDTPNTAPTIFAGVVSSGSITKTGTGTLALNSPTGNTYTGGTVLAASAGTLSVNNTAGSGTGSGAVSIGGTTGADRSTLSGNFTIGGATAISGALIPGSASAVGTANFDSSLTLTTNALTTLNIAGSSSSSKINVGGAFTRGGSTFAVVTIGGYLAVAGDSFDLADWGSASGTATVDVSAAVLADPSGTAWDTSAFTTTGVISVVPVPEPGAALAIAVAGMLAFVWVRRRAGRVVAA